MMINNDDHMEELTYDELMRIHAREKSPRLSAIPSNFYDLAGRFLASYNKADPNGMREYSNALKMIKFIYHRRLEKIFNYVLSYDKGLELPPEMLDYERELYMEIVPLVKKFGDALDHKLVSPEDICPPKEEIKSILKEKKDKVKIIITKDVEEFIGANGSVIGPFKENSEIELIPEDAEMLVQIGAARKIE